MKNEFYLNGGSVMGVEHQRRGINNQDAFHWLHGDGDICAVVCDGCSSAKKSEVGAGILSTLFTRAIINSAGQYNLHTDTSHENIRRVLDKASNTALSCIREIIKNLSIAPTSQEEEHGFTRNLYDFFLTTVAGFYVNREITVLFVKGDAFFYINNSSMAVGGFEHNMPPYMAYALAPPPQFVPQTPFQQLDIVKIMPTCEVENLLVGSDGVNQLVDLGGRTFPGSHEKIESIASLCKKPLHGRNQDSIRRWLFRINKPSIRYDQVENRIIKTEGLLSDDTTLIIMGRKDVKK